MKTKNYRFKKVLNPLLQNWYASFLIILCSLILPPDCLGKNKYHPTTFYGTFQVTKMVKVSNCYAGIPEDRAKDKLNKEIMITKDSYLNTEGRTIGQSTVRYRVDIYDEESQFCLATIVEGRDATCTNLELKVLDSSIQKYFPDAAPELYTHFEISDQNTLYNEIGCWIYKYKRTQ